MSICKCKMCGGALEISPGETVSVCEYCGTKQTLPKLDSERKANLYDRASHFRRNNDFDRAIGIYEQILAADDTDAESYWSLVLCRYGIEYVEDPASHKRLPTVNRTQTTSIFADGDYLSALRCADGYQRAIYEEEAAAIDRIQKGILDVSRREEPFDVFICYKESDYNGRRTVDSVLAMDLYKELTAEGYRVFFSRITLEDKLGTAYEPYIYAALNSAKVMIAVGTRPEHFNAVWVKNEWSRYLALIHAGEKKYLIPAYRDMDPYDLPEEFSHLQAQDMSKLGFLQDLVHGVKKLVPKQAQEPAADSSAQTDALLRRAFLFLEDGDWKSADEYCEKVLDQNPENAMAYMGKLMAELHVPNWEALEASGVSFEENGNYQKAYRYADPALRQWLGICLEKIRSRNAEAEKEQRYASAQAAMAAATDTRHGRGNRMRSITAAIDMLEQLGEYQDSQALLEEARNARSALQKEPLIPRKTVLLTVGGILAVTAAFAFVRFALPGIRYQRAISMSEQGNYDAAISIWYDLEDYQESEAHLEQAYYDKGRMLMENQQFAEAEAAFAQIESVRDVSAELLETRYGKACQLQEAGQFEEACTLFEELGDYEESSSRKHSCRQGFARQLMDAGDYEAAIELLQSELSYASARELINECYQSLIQSAMDAGDYETANNYLNMPGCMFSSDTEMYKMVKYGLGNYYMEEGDYLKAANAFGMCRDYRDVWDLYLQVQYYLGVQYMEEGAYYGAVCAFIDCDGYRDSEYLKQDAMYQYVYENRDYNENTYWYLLELMEANYLDSAEIYKEIFGWKVTNIRVNTDPDDNVTAMSSISAYDPVYFHFDLEGGAPWEKTRLTRKITYPDGSTITAEWDYDMGATENHWCGWESAIYTNPAYGARGTLKVDFYDGEGNLIGSGSVQIT